MAASCHVNRLVVFFKSEMEKRRKVSHYNDAGHIHELTFSCYRKLQLLGKDRTRIWLAQAISDAKVKHDLLVLAYVFMPDHVHLLLKPNQANYDMAEIIKSIKQPVSRRSSNWLRTNNPEFLKQLSCRQSGREIIRFWQKGCGYDRNIIEEKSLRSVINYIHNNPVRIKIVEKAIDWKWSSASWYEQGKQGAVTIDSIPW